MKKKQLRKSEIKDLSDSLQKLYGRSFFTKESRVEIVEDEMQIIVVDGVPSFFYQDSIPIPTIKLCLKNCFLKKIVVDMGAVKFVTNGADIMRPGIVNIDQSINAGEFVAVVDQKNGVPLSICKALFSGADMQLQEKGKVLKNIHFVGDKIWTLQL